MTAKGDEYRLGWITGRTESFAEHVVLRQFHELLQRKPWLSAEGCWQEAMRVYGQSMLREFDNMTDEEKLKYEAEPHLHRWIDNIRSDNFLDLPRYLR